MKASQAGVSTVFTTYDAMEEAMLRFVQTAFFNGAFLSTLTRGGYRPQQIRYFALQYSYYSRNFPRVLGAAIAAMEPTDTWWIPLADNLWDEAGRGVSGRSHQQLYLTFLRSVYPDAALHDDSSPVIPMSSSVRQAIDTFISFFRTCSPVAAMAAVGLGSELFAGQVMGAIGAALRHPNYQAWADVDALFWDVHADEHEPRHYALCRDILCQYTTPEALSHLYEVGIFIAKSEADMYQGLHVEMLSLTP